MLYVTKHGKLCQEIASLETRLYILISCILQLNPTPYSKVFSDGSCCHLSGTFLKLHSKNIVLECPLKLLISKYLLLNSRFSICPMPNWPNSLILTAPHVPLSHWIILNCVTHLTSHLYPSVLTWFCLLAVHFRDINRITQYQSRPSQLRKS